ncbi:hypothetical protein A4S06_10420 [Erysipelotrichaceae bacterium MTC7]|nr:hypothetical protein A4S06_10420 [Erysipelotrichaceae bacterium MTC7]
MDINISNYLRINLQDMALVLISTVLIVLFAKKFFWKYAQAYLDGRTAYVAGELEAAHDNREQSQVMKSEYETKLANAHAEATGILESAKHKASVEANQILEKAHNDARLYKEKAQVEIEQEKTSIRKNIKDEISDIAFLAAKKVVEKEMDDDTHKKYVKDFIEQAQEDETWQA